MKIIQYTTRKGNFAWREEGPFPAESHGTTPTTEFGDRKGDEVGACYVGLNHRDRFLVEICVMKVIMDMKPMEVARYGAKKLGVSRQRVGAASRTAFLRLARICKEKGL
jgi:hypothetical protein